MTKSRLCTFALITASVAALLAGPAGRALAGFFNNRSVGGVAITAEGVLEAPTEQDARELEQVRQQAQLKAPVALEEFTEQRAVSLKQIEAAVGKAHANMMPVPDEVKYLAGLQRVRYVFVYPDKKDIVLVGPAEGWDMDPLGNVVGVTTKRPVLLLDDLMVALRSGKASRETAITCSIDPTAEGLKKLQELVSQLSDIGDKDRTLGMIEDALGPQTVSVTGVAGESHFARAMVAADFRMKRLAMNFEPAPVKGMPSFLSMVKGGGRGMQNMLPRWWLAPNYQPLAKTADNLAWELRGPGVKCMTEEDYVNANGQKEHTGKASGPAVTWAQTMSDKYEELANHDSSFGQLRNIMDLAVIGALIEKEQLMELAGLSAPRLMGEEALDRFPVPKQTASKASVLRARGGWVISASGGVEMLPWTVADKTETVAGVGDVRSEMSSDGTEFWWE